METLKTGLLIFITVFVFIPRDSFAGRPKIKEVTFKENSVFSDRTLKNHIVSRKSSIFKTRRFFREVLKEDLNTLRDFYTERGYLSISFNEKTIIDDEDNTVKIIIEVDEGERFIFSTIMFLGNDFYSYEELLKRTGIKDDDFFSRGTLNRAVSRLISFYLDTGFIDIEIDTDININSTLNTVSVDFFIREGNRYKVNDTKLRGNVKTRDSVLLRELTFKKGEYINFSRLFDSRQKFMRTGLFRSIFIRPQSSENNETENKKNIIIEVAERDSIEFGVSAGYDTREYFWQKLEANNRNLYGTARKLGLTLRRSGISRRAQAVFASPWNFGIPLNIDVDIYTGYKEEPGYEVFETGGGLSLGKTVRELIRISLAYDYKESEFKNIEDEQFKRKRVKKNIATLLLNYDTRDSIFYPSRGIYAALKNEIILGDFSFMRTALDTRVFRPLTSRLIIGSSVRGAVIFSGHKLAELPPDERLYTGGPNSVRGYKYRRLGPINSRDDPTGGKVELVWNVVDLRLNIYKGLGILLFADTGNIWKTLENTDVKQLRSSAGGGVTLTLPIGVFRLEYGLKLDRKEEESPGVLFFGTGLVF